MTDLLLPDPYVASKELCWSAYRLGRKNAVLCCAFTRGVRAGLLDAPFISLVEEERIGDRLTFHNLQMAFYQARLKMLRSYALFVRLTHGER